MITTLKITLVLLLALIICSCSGEIKKYPYRMGQNGLIYNSHNNELYTGMVRDTNDVIIEYEVKNGMKDGIFATYYLNGEVEKKGLIKNNLNQGEWTYYYQNGILESKGSYLNDHPDGVWTFYFSTGKKREQGSFIKGKRNGEWTMYNEEGKVKKTVIFKDDKVINSIDSI